MFISSRLGYPIIARAIFSARNINAEEIIQGDKYERINGTGARGGKEESRIDAKENITRTRRCAAAV
jgi:ribosomal protein L19E